VKFATSPAAQRSASHPDRAGDTGDTGTGDSGTTDTGASDSGTTDTGAPDTGPSTDSGTGAGDTGPSTDSGTGADDTGTAPDTGDSGQDSGQDTGSGDTGSDTGAAPSDSDVLTVQVIDLATYDGTPDSGVVFEGSTDGTGGLFSADVELSAGGHYVVLVAGESSVSEQPLDYTLVLSGSTPTDSTILVGAYLGSDPSVAENPAGGTNATGWTYDTDTYTWSASWKMMWIRTVAASEDTDTGDDFIPAATVKETPDTVYVRGGTLTTLDASPSAGALYATTSIEVHPSGDGETAVGDALVLDGVFPKVIGKQITETLPDTTNAVLSPADYTLDEATLNTQDVGMLSGLGYVDTFDGSIVFDPSASGWNGTNDSDAYAFTVPESMYVRMTAGWPDAQADIDFGIFYADPTYGIIDLFSSYGDSYCLTSSDPEACESVVTLDPDTTYYLVALGYVGTDEQAYHVELEWVAP
jgi:hypothetical protein